MRDFFKWGAGGSGSQPPSGAPPAQPPPPPLPPVSAEYQSTVQAAGQGSKPQQFPWKLSRSGDGKMRVDHGDKSVINNPAEGRAMMLDHVKKEALLLPKPPALPQGIGQPPAMPGGAGQGSPPAAPNVKDLGKKMIQEHEAEGKLYTFQPPAMPKPPSAAPPPAPQPPAGGPPQPPQPPQVPGGAAPQIPKPPTLEVWTSKKLGLPLLTKSSGPGGRQMDECKKLSTGEPPPTAFQVPPGYKMIKLPELPKPPQAPKMPQVPKMPAFKMPAVPKLAGS